MTILYSKRNKAAEAMAKQEAQNVSITKPCPACGHTASVVERYPNKDVFQCSNCNSVNVFMRVNDAAQRKQKDRNPGILVRDKSKEKENKEETKEEEKGVDLEKSLSVARNGMEDTQLLSFHYTSSSGEKSSRKVEPYKLEVNKNGEVVMWAYCLEKQGIRQFKLKGTVNMTQVPTTYKPRWPVEDKTKKKDAE